MMAYLMAILLLQKKQKLEAGTVVIAAGMSPRRDEAMAIGQAVERFVMVGDCTAAGNVEKAMRTAYGAAVTL